MNNDISRDLSSLWLDILSALLLIDLFSKLLALTGFYDVRQEDNRVCQKHLYVC
jgi:hypothetical protein